MYHKNITKILFFPKNIEKRRIVEQISQQKYMLTMYTWKTLNIYALNIYMCYIYFDYAYGSREIILLNIFNVLYFLKLFAST